MNIHISGINCDNALNPDTHNFDFASSIVTTGEIYINEPTVGAKVKMDISVTIGDPNGGTITGDIVAVTGVVNPEINIAPVTFDINDIPDFLKQDSYLDIENPQIYLTIENTSAASVNVDITLTGNWDTGVYPNGNEPIVKQPLTIAPDTTIYVSAARDGVAQGYTAYQMIISARLSAKYPTALMSTLKHA